MINPKDYNFVTDAWLAKQKSADLDRAMAHLKACTFRPDYIGDREARKAIREGISRIYDAQAAIWAREAISREIRAGTKIERLAPPIHCDAVLTGWKRERNPSKAVQDEFRGLVRQFVAESGVTLDQIATRAGIHPRGLRNWLQNVTRAGDGYFTKIANAMAESVSA